MPPKKKIKEVTDQNINYKILTVYANLARKIVPHVEQLSKLANPKTIIEFENTLTAQEKLLYYSILGKDAGSRLKDLIRDELESELETTTEEIVN